MSIHGKITVIGGDKRLYYMASLLKQEQCCVQCYQLETDSKEECGVTKTLQEALREADIIIGPIPFSRDGISVFSNQNPPISICDFMDSLREGQILFAGSISQTIREAAEKKQIILYDLMELEDVAVKNAIATAEGAIAEAITISDKNLNQSKCLVLGYGRCAKALAYRLKGLSASVTVAARKQEQRLQAGVRGFHMLDTKELEKEISQFDFIFNTIPARMLEQEKISRIKKETVIIDIASKPGGTDFEACKTCNVRAILALGLPGKYSPKTSAEILLEAMRHLLSDSCLGV